MKISLRYFTGTGNSKRIAEECAKRFETRSHVVDLSSVTKIVSIPPDAEWVGLVVPVYAFGIPRLCRRYLQSLPTQLQSRKAFVIVTAGARDESGFSTRECRELLRNKNIQVVYSTVIQMPINWVTFVPLQTPEEAAALIEEGVRQAAQVDDEILDGQTRSHVCQKPDRYSLVRFYFEYFAFKYLGIRQLWKMFVAAPTCSGCGKCARICPAGGVSLSDGRPKWNSRCEQCMRCVNACPHRAIYQKYGRKDQGGQRYLEPTFQPVLEDSSV